MDLGFAGKVVAVAGASKGIGFACAEAFAREGAKVALVSRSAANLDAALTRLKGVACTPITCVADLVRADEAARMADQVETALGPIDVLVNSAGAARRYTPDDLDVAAWHAAMDAKYFSYIHPISAVLPGMAARGRGRVINVASTAGLTGYAYVSAYVAAKHGVIGLTRSLALEYARRGVTVNAVCPGYTDTPLVAGAAANIVAKTGRSEAEARATLAKVNPMQRLVTPEEVADTIVFLASIGASAINGQAVAVAGGEVFTG
jgi:NAD(P)-dependent dehydrogenase (short-subunit alcohol dehydrogenase family)